MRLLARVAISSGIVVGSAILGLLAGFLSVRYVFPPPVLFSNGGREGTPVQIVAFFGSFGLVSLIALAVGFHLLGRRAPGSSKA